MPASPEFALACAELLHRDGSIYALLDAARDPGVRAFLTEHAPAATSLYAGFDPELADVAPYVTRLQPHQTAALVSIAWGDSWGVFVRTAVDIDALRRHFRRFLMVELEGGEEVYFRFYDPRVLRSFLPTCVAEQRDDFFGPIESLFSEGEESHLLLQFDARRSDPLPLVVETNGFNEAR
jgi:hypothetical protein